MIHKMFIDQQTIRSLYEKTVEIFRQMKRDEYAQFMKWRGDHRSCNRSLSNSELSPKKKKIWYSGLQRDSNPWPLRLRCSALFPSLYGEYGKTGKNFPPNGTVQFSHKQTAYFMMQIVEWYSNNFGKNEKRGIS